MGVAPALGLRDHYLEHRAVAAQDDPDCARKRRATPHRVPHPALTAQSCGFRRGGGGPPYRLDGQLRCVSAPRRAGRRASTRRVAYAGSAPWHLLCRSRRRGCGGESRLPPALSEPTGCWGTGSHAAVGARLGQVAGLAEAPERNRRAPWVSGAQVREIVMNLQLVGAGRVCRDLVPTRTDAEQGFAGPGASWG